MIVFLSILYMVTLVKSYSYIFNPLLKFGEASKLRKHLREEMCSSYKYLTYPIAKKILHDHVNMIDIYGDNIEDKNVEHIFPQFSFNHHENKCMMRSDLHNLYLCNSKINSYRQNFKYVDSSGSNGYDNIKILDLKGNVVSNNAEIFKQIGYLMISNKKNRIFVPTPYSRGKIARSLSYFAIKYDYISELKKIIDIETLLEWNIKDPVDNDEYLKNIIIYKYQKNVNPFVLDPDLMLYCFADMATIDNELLKKKRYSNIDPLYTIEYLLNNINELENLKSFNDKIMLNFFKKYNV